MRPSIRRCDALLAAVLAGTFHTAPAQSLFDSMREAGASRPGGYLFVSERVSDTALIALARDARRAGFTIVLNGFWGDLDATRQRVAQINDACCGAAGARWQVNPPLFQRYQVSAVPAFVVAVNAGAGPQDFSKVTGEMGLANALKTFGQQSRLPAVRRFATLTYTKAFATQ